MLRVFEAQFVSDLTDRFAGIHNFLFGHIDQHQLYVLLC